MKLTGVVVVALLSSGFALNEPHFASEAKNGTYCELCQDVVEYLDSVITKPENEEFVRKRSSSGTNVG